MIEAGTRDAVYIPADAIVKVGQLEAVMVRLDDSWEKYHVKTGKRSNGMVEILSGLEGGEVIGIAGDTNAR